MENATAVGAGVQACGWLSSHRWVLFAACGLFLCFVPWGVDPHHDGLMLKSAMDVAAGRVVFRDSFNQYGLLTSLLQGAAVRFFGAEIIVLRLLTVLFYALSAMELDRLWCRFLSEPFRWLTFGLFLGLAPFYVWIMLSWSSVYALYFMLLGGTLMVRYLEGGGLRLLFGCGVAAGIAFGFRQPCGIVMVPAGILTLGLEVWTRRLKFREALYRFGIWSGGVLVFPAFLALYLTVFGAWRDYWRQCWVNTARFSQDAGGDRITDLLSCLFPADSVFLLFPLAALGCFGWMVWRLWRRRSGEWQLPFCAALLVGLASWHQYYPVPCLRHCYWGGDSDVRGTGFCRGTVVAQPERAQPADCPVDRAAGLAGGRRTMEDRERRSEFQPYRSEGGGGPRFQRLEGECFRRKTFPAVCRRLQSSAGAAAGAAVAESDPGCAVLPFLPGTAEFSPDVRELGISGVPGLSGLGR